MCVGVPKEIKNNEFHVGMTPGAVTELVHRGHGVIVGAGAGIGLDDASDRAARATIAASLEQAKDLAVETRTWK